MDITDYIVKSSKTAIYPSQKTLGGLDYVIMGMGGEAGEVSEILKKVVRDSNGFIVDIDRVIGEISDILWYWSQIMVETQGKFEDKFDVDSFQKDIAVVVELGKLEISDPELIGQLTDLMKHFYICYGKICEEYVKVNSQESYIVVCRTISNINVEVLKILAGFLTVMGVKLSTAMQGNLDKLSARMKAGKIGGSGEELHER